MTFDDGYTIDFIVKKDSKNRIRIIFNIMGSREKVKK